MIPIKSPLAPRVTWGNPWHGRFDAAGLALDSGPLKPFTIPANAPETWRVQFDGIPEPVTPPELAEQGGIWTADALLFTCEKRYSPAGGPGIGYNRWFWRDANGVVWLLRLTFSNSVNAPSVGASSSMTVSLYAARFEVGTPPAEDETRILFVFRTWTNRGPGTGLVYPHLTHSPTGSRTAITFRTGPVAFMGLPVAGDMVARTAMARASLGSALYELRITGVNASGLPVAQLLTVVDSAAALVTTNQSIPGPIVGDTAVVVAGGGSQYGSLPPGSSYDVDYGWEEYGVSSAQYPASTGTVTSRLICGGIQGEAVLPIWHRVEVWNMRLATANGSGIIGRFDWSYKRPWGVSGWEAAFEAERVVSGFNHSAMRALKTIRHHAVLIGSTAQLEWEAETVSRTDYNSSMPATTDIGLPDGTDWSDGRKSFMTHTVTQTYERRVNGELVASGVPEVVHDPLRASWTEAVPVIASNNIVALCPRGGGQLYLDQLVTESGISTQESPSPVGTWGELLCPSFNPRYGAMTVAINAINGYV